MTRQYFKRGLWLLAGLVVVAFSAPEWHVMAAEPGAPRATFTGTERLAKINAMLDRQEAELAKNPNNPNGWIRLGRSRLQLEQYEKAKSAFKQAADLLPEDPDVLTEYASAIMSASPNPQVIEPEMAEVLKKIAAVDPEDRNALWYLGLWEKQQGRPKNARPLWERLLSKLPPETLPWVRLKTQIDALP